MPASSAGKATPRIKLAHSNDAAAPHRVEWHWVKGHSGHPENDRVDALACTEADARR